MMEVKEHLSHLTIHETTKSIFDVSLAAYLVNPLKALMNMMILQEIINL